MRNRRDFASVVRNVEDGVKSVLQMVGIVTSASGDGKIVNAKTYMNGEVRELIPVLPYGISSSAMDNTRVQVIINDGDTNVMAGVIDPSRPPVAQGELVLYNKTKSTTLTQLLTRIDTLEAKVASLESRVASLEAQAHTH